MSTPQTTPDYELAGRALVQLAQECYHGEIFQECYAGADGENDPDVLRPRQDEFQDLVATTNEILPAEREMRAEDGEDLSQYPEQVNTPEGVLAFWKGYFRDYPSHGEYAGMVAHLLVREQRWRDLYDILKICEGSDGFGWDS